MDWVNQTIRTTADTKVCESKLYKKDNNCWYLDVIVEKDIPEKLHYQNVIGIDMGIRHIATYVELANGLTKFCGKDLNRVRGHYFWLRRKLGIKKAIDTMKKIGSHEKRIANDIIHNISRDIVNQAINTNAIIVLAIGTSCVVENRIHEEKSLTESCPAFNTTTNTIHNIQSSNSRY